MQQVRGIYQVRRFRTHEACPNRFFVTSGQGPLSAQKQTPSFFCFGNVILNLSAVIWSCCTTGRLIRGSLGGSEGLFCMTGSKGRAERPSASYPTCTCPRTRSRARPGGIGEDVGEP